MKKNQFTLFFTLLFTLTFALFTGCGTSKDLKDSKSEIKTEPKAVTAAANKFEYKMDAGKEYKYSLASDTKQTMTMMGQEQSFNMKMFAIVSIKPGEVLPDGNYSTILTADSLKLESDSPQMPDMSADLAKMNGKKFKSVIKKNGAITAIEQIDQYEVSESAKNVLSEMDPKAKFKNLLLEFPDKSLNVGDTWSETKIDSTSRMGGKVHTKTISDYKVAGKEKVNGKDVYKINVNTKIEMSGNGSQMGNDFTITGKGKASSDYNFCKDDGILTDYKVDQALDMSIDISAMGMTMPMTILTTTNAKLIK